MADTIGPSSEFDNSGNKALHVPGFGCPYDLQLDRHARYLHGVVDSMYPRITAREVAMLQVMDRLTDKPDWRKKVFDEAIVAKWRDEAKGMELISEKAFEWCITELRDRATEGRGQFTVTLDAGTRCVKADGLVSEELRHEFSAAVQPLLDAPVKDWHPGSGGQVLNLIHPSMYPLIYGRTRVVKSGSVKLDDVLEARDDKFIARHLPPKGESTDFIGNFGEIKPNPGFAWSTKYQWLPCDVAFVDHEGLEVKITSYINNLPYRGHEKLYECIEKLISASIPLWNEVLETPQEVKDPSTLSEYSFGRTPLRILTRGAEELDKGDRDWIEDLPDEMEWLGKGGWEKVVDRVTEYLKKPDRPENLAKCEAEEDPPPNWATDIEWGPRRTAQWKYDRVRRIVHPEPFFESTYEDWKQGKARPFVIRSGTEQCEAFPRCEVSIENTFRQRGLQVIVKVASIELTPEKPTYGGGNWHLEGMLNEHIVATAIYYFDVQNVTQSRIRYRQDAFLDSVDIAYEQHDHFGLETVFGVEDLRDGPMIQEVGSIITTEGRLLVFPNTRQHRVDPFELVDKAKPGHRRFIVLWLVDPHYRVLSTKNVPPQQYSWWKEKTDESTDRHLPGEVHDLIQEELKGDTMTRAQAEQYRLELMEERTTATDEIHRHTSEYNFCEH